MRQISTVLVIVTISVLCFVTTSAHAGVVYSDPDLTFSYDVYSAEPGKTSIFANITLAGRQIEYSGGGYHPTYTEQNGVYTPSKTEGFFSFGWQGTVTPPSATSMYQSQSMQINKFPLELGMGLATFVYDSLNDGGKGMIDIDSLDQTVTSAQTSGTLRSYGNAYAYGTFVPYGRAATAYYDEYMAPDNTMQWNASVQVPVKWNAGISMNTLSGLAIGSQVVPEPSYALCLLPLVFLAFVRRPVRVCTCV